MAFSSERANDVTHQRAKPTKQIPRLDYYSSPKSIFDALQHNDVGLVKGSWLVELAHYKGILAQRQHLPAAAFWNPRDLFHPDGSLCKSFVAVSHAWLTKDHPDPDGVRVHLIGVVIQMINVVFGDVAVYWDWCSLYQEPRTPEEQIQFDRSVADAAIWWMHSRVIKLLVTTEPAGFDARSYGERGWPTFERQVSCMITESNLVIDLSSFGPGCQDYKSLVNVCSKRRLPPVAPNCFGQMLRKRLWTVEADRRVVERLYQELFMSWISGIKTLEFQNHYYGDEQVILLAGAIRHCARLQYLDLTGNQMTNEGAAKLAQAVPRCRKLTDLILQGNQIGTRGVQLIQEAWKKAKKPENGLRVSGTDHDTVQKAAREEEEDGFYYEGMYKNNQRHGEGMLWNPGNGFRYVGAFEADLFNGHGRGTWQDGSTYTGQWLEGQKEGEGEYISGDGLKYVGEWVRGQRQGTGTQQYEDGGKYHGLWARGLCSGAGTYVFANGSRYVGQWRLGRYNGHGVMHHCDGTMERLDYKNGLLMKREVVNNNALPLVVTRTGDTMVETLGKTMLRQQREDIHQPARLPSLGPQRLINRDAEGMDLSAPPLRPRSASRLPANPIRDTPRLPLTCR